MATTRVECTPSPLTQAIRDALDHGQCHEVCDIESGTYDGNVTTGSDRGAKARIYSNTADGVGRFTMLPLRGRTGGEVVMRFVFVLGASGTGAKAVFRLDGPLPMAIGDTLNSGGLGSAGAPFTQEFEINLNAVGAHVQSYVDVTIDEACFDQSKPFWQFNLTRLSASDGDDNYTAASFYHELSDFLYTGYGVEDEAVAPP